MSAFVQVGAHWINLERVTNVEPLFNPDLPLPPQLTDQPVGVRVRYTTSLHQDFTDPNEVLAISNALQAHHVT